MTLTRRVFILAMGVVAGALPVFASTAHATGCTSTRDDFVAALNAERAEAGVAPLTAVGPLADYADGHSATMAAEGTIFHTNPLTDAAAGIDGWSLLGENVGMGGDVEPLMDAFMASAGHRENVLNASYTFVGVGVVDVGDTIFTTHVFMAGGDMPAGGGLDCASGDAEAAPQPDFGGGLVDGSGSGHFADDDGNPHEDRIDAIAAAGITTGCADGSFCPDQVVTRAQMAVFLLRGLDMAGRSASGAAMPDRFGDDNGDWAEESINAVADMGVTSGCAPGMFCPDSPVTRAEMAMFLVQALHLPAAGDAGFDDADGHWAEDAIDALASAGITSGSAPGVFDPDAAVTRAEMATFLYRAFLAS